MPGAEPFQLPFGLLPGSRAISHSRGVMEGSPIGRCPTRRPMSLRTSSLCSGPLQAVLDHRFDDYVRFGSEADVAVQLRNVRLVPEADNPLV